MQIRYLDGLRFRRAILAGAHGLILQQQHLDAINVFPVPDSDTGTNMAATMQHVAAEARRLAEPAIGVISIQVADAALMGARGNSGVILAQFFQGLAEGLTDRATATPGIFAEAVMNAARWAREAVSAPREGTILSVLGAWAEAVHTAADETPDFAPLLSGALGAARTALARTPDQLAVLRRAGVVDAGAQGFVYLLEGVQAFIEAGRLADPQAEEADVLIGQVHAHTAPEDFRFRYCTECLVEGTSLERDALRREAEALGDSVVVAGSRRKVRVHLHTDDPRAAFERFALHGAVAGEKVDDMRQQHADAFGAGPHHIAIVTDTGCDLPDDLLARYNIHRVPLRVQFAGVQFIDRVTLTPGEFYRRLSASPEPPKTSQPTPGDFKRTYERVARHYDAAVSIHVPGRLSGTLQSARHVAARVSDRITVIDGRSVSVGLGLIVLEAARAIEEGADLSVVRRRVEAAADGLRLFIALDTMEHAVRGGRLSRFKGMLGRMLHVRPVLTFDAAGDVVVVDKAFSSESALRKVAARAREAAADLTDLRVAVAHAAAPEAAQRLAEVLEAALTPAELFITEVSPALGVHGGPGAVGAALLGRPGKDASGA